MTNYFFNVKATMFYTRKTDFSKFQVAEMWVALVVVGVCETSYFSDGVRVIMCACIRAGV